MGSIEVMRLNNQADASAFTTIDDACKVARGFIPLVK
jgi:hypothetical protein